MDLPFRPAIGDVLIVEVCSPRRYLLRRFGGKDQLAYEWRNKATATAVSFAKSASVDLWYSPDGVRFELLNAFRPLRNRRQDQALKPVALGAVG